MRSSLNVIKVSGEIVTLCFASKVVVVLPVLSVVELLTTSSFDKADSNEERREQYCTLP